MSDSASVMYNGCIFDMEVTPIMLRSTFLKLGVVVMLLLTLLGCSNEEKPVTNAHTEYTDLKEYLINFEEDLSIKLINLQEKLDSLEKELNKLTKKNRDLEYELMLTNSAMTTFPSAWPAAQTFLDAYFNQDLDIIQQMLNERYTVSEKGISTVSEGEEILMPFVVKNDNDSYYLNTFGKIQSGLFVQIMIVAENESDASAGFINLQMVRRGHEWSIKDLSFDI